MSSSYNDRKIKFRHEAETRGQETLYKWLNYNSPHRSENELIFSPLFFQKLFLHFCNGCANKIASEMMVLFELGRVALLQTHKYLSNVILEHIVEQRMVKRKHNVPFLFFGMSAPKAS